MQDTRVPASISKVAATAFLLLIVHLLSLPVRAQVAPSDKGKLKLVVALFRHGIRPPLEGFACSAHQYSGKAWPALADWHAIAGAQGPQWGNLTVHGKLLAQALGRHYASHYRDTVGPHGAQVFLWADVDERTQQTAMGLRDGFCWPPTAAIACHARLDGLFMTAPAGQKDTLFHPFATGCGKPDPDRLNKIVSEIKAGREEWMRNLQSDFQMLQETLNCNRETFSDDCKKNPPAKCVPLLENWLQRDNVSPGCGPGRCPDKPDSDPIKWTGAFSYASGASEAFLLEYANDLAADKVGWGRTDPPNSLARPKLAKMLEVHEFFFDKTQRDDYIAQIQGSNLVREILDDLERAAGGEVMGCPHGTPENKFIGLVGHDTNLAGMGKLLDLNWNFDSTPLQGVPAKDAMPAGALIFELRDRGLPGKHDFFVRVSYVTLAPQQMRAYKPSMAPPKPVWVKVTGSCGDGQKCEMSLDKFQAIAKKALGQGEFLSKCQGDRQVCNRNQP